jgi:signal transduction histidine kinase
VTSPHRRRSPSRTLAIGVVLALGTIAAVGAYTFAEVRRLRDEQTAISERNRKDSLQLLRIQNDLASLAVLMRDMADGVEPYPLKGWQPAFDRIRRDLQEATALEQTLAPAAREPAQQARLRNAIDAYWTDVDRMFVLGGTDEPAARKVIRGTLIPQHRAIDGMVSQFLVVNNRIQEEAARANREIYDRVGREILLLVGALLIVTATVGVWVVRSNRRAFDEVGEVSEQLRTLSWRTLRVQEDVQRSISRELHDDFGQIVTAIGTLLGRVRRHAAEGALAAELDSVRGIAQQALDRIRSRSQWLHPGVLDDFGLQRALELCVDQFAKQTGIRSKLTVSGPVSAIRDDCAIHVYRIAQEALSNIGRHSGSAEAWVRLTCVGEGLELEVEDRGRGIPLHGDAIKDDATSDPGKSDPVDPASRVTHRGLGLVSMRERAELIGGELKLRRPPQGGLTVHVRVPSCTVAAPAARDEVA